MQSIINKCNVCNKVAATRVLCSACGPISLAYCGECSKRMAEPKDMLQYMLDDVGGIDNLIKEFHSLTYYENGSYHSIVSLK